MGDSEAKLAKYGGIPNVVSAIPDIFSFNLDEDIDFLILGCKKCSNSSPNPSPTPSHPKPNPKLNPNSNSNPKLNPKPKPKPNPKLNPKPKIGDGIFDKLTN